MKRSLARRPSIGKVCDVSFDRGAVSPPQRRAGELQRHRVAIDERDVGSERKEMRGRGETVYVRRDANDRRQARAPRRRYDRGVPPVAGVK